MNIEDTIEPTNEHYSTTNRMVFRLKKRLHNEKRISLPEVGAGIVRQESVLTNKILSLRSSELSQYQTQQL